MSGITLRSYTSGLLVVDVIADPVEPGYFFGIRPAYHVGSSILRSDGSVVADLPPVPIGYPARGYNGYVAFVADPQMLTNNTLVLALWNAYPSETATRIADVRYSGDQLVNVMGKSPQDQVGSIIQGTLKGVENIGEILPRLIGALPLIAIGYVMLKSKK